VAEAAGGVDAGWVVAGAAALSAGVGVWATAPPATTRQATATRHPGRVFDMIFTPGLWEDRKERP
jgi:hypothetical protein